MSDLLVAIPLLVEWALAVTVAAPFALVNNRWIYAHPTAGLMLWFGAFISAAVSLAVAFGLAVWSVFETYLKLADAASRGDVWLGLLASFSPWLILAIGGISLAVITQRLESEIDFAKPAPKPAAASSKSSWVHRGVRVVEIDLPMAFAFSLGTSVNGANSQIVLSTKVRRSLSSEELKSLLDHEHFHLKAGHALGQKLVQILGILTGRFMTTRVLAKETALLFELAADKHSAARNSRVALRTALTTLAGNTGKDRELGLRLAHLDDVERPAA